MTLSISLSQTVVGTAHAADPYLNASFRRRHTVDFKTDFHDIVAEADTESQRIVPVCIFATYPDSLVVSEKAEGLLDRSRAIRPLTNEDIVWYIDPINGTSNFAADFDHWYVSIAAARGGELLTGAAYQPIRDLVFHANETDAYRNGERIPVSTASFTEDIVGTEFPSPRINDVDAALHGFGHLLGSAHSLRHTGSTTLIFTEAATGSFLATFNVGIEPQDVAAGALLVEHTGGRFIGWGDEADGSADVTAGRSDNGTNGDGTDAQPVYHRSTWAAPNLVTVNTPKATRACLAAAEHPDPDTTVVAA